MAVLTVRTSKKKAGRDVEHGNKVVEEVTWRKSLACFPLRPSGFSNPQIHSSHLDGHSSFLPQSDKVSREAPRSVALDRLRVGGGLHFSVHVCRQIALAGGGR